MNYTFKRFTLFIILILFVVGGSYMPTAEAARKTRGCSLKLTSVPSNSSIEFGEEVAYKYTLSNIGSKNCIGTKMSIKYGDNEKYISSNIAPTTSDDYWHIGSLNRGESFILSVNIKNIINSNSYLYGEACASANGTPGSCVKKPVKLTAVTKPIVQQPVEVTPVEQSPVAEQEPVEPNPVTEQEPVVSNPITEQEPVESNPVVEQEPVEVSPIVEQEPEVILVSDNTNTMNIQAWVYPGNPACNADEEYADGRIIDTLKPEYYTVDTSGALKLLTEAAYGCNGYSTSNVAHIKQYSNNQFVTVSSGTTNMRRLLSSSTLQEAAIKTLTDFVVNTGFTGVELDWEGFGTWSASDYTNYKKFVANLQSNLRAKGKKLMIDAPAISDTKYQSYFQFKYEDFVDVDYVAIMAYDYQYDYGVGQSVAPEAWLKNVINWAKARLDIDQIIIGIPNYGYHGETGTYNVSIDTYEQSKTYDGYSGRTTNSEGEETWTSGNTFYLAQTTKSLDRRKALIESMGIKSISVWHLGGNPWFSN